MFHAAAVAFLLAACSDARPRGATCNVDHLDVTWGATVERGGATTSQQLSATVTPANVTQQLFDSLVRTLVEGDPEGPAVVWSVPAFDTDPGGIAVAHKTALSRGEVMRVAGVLDTAGWGLAPGLSVAGATAGIEAGEFVAREVSGTIAVLETEPVALRLDLTARDSLGETIRVRGDARFGRRRERARCASVAGVRGPRNEPPGLRPYTLEMPVRGPVASGGS